MCHIEGELIVSRYSMMKPFRKAIRRLLGPWFNKHRPLVRLLIIAGLVHLCAALAAGLLP